MQEIQVHNSKALADFLKSRRIRLDPKDFGISDTRKRRTQGLRREEVAEFAGISNTWYVWLEQGRDIRASVETLNAIAEAMRLTQAEHIHLLKLARPDLDVENHPPPEAMPSEGLIALLANLAPHPAFVLNRYSQIVLVNRPMDKLLGPFDDQDEELGNLIGSIFLNPLWKNRFPDWETVAGDCVAQFRQSAETQPDDPVFRALIARFQAESEDFSRYWDDPDIADSKNWEKAIFHPDVGVMNFYFATLAGREEDEDFSISIYTPANADAYQRLSYLCRD